MPQIRLKPVTREEKLKLKVNPFTPLAYNKYTHQLIDSHMLSHAKRISGAKSRVDTSIPKSAVRCVRSRDRFKLPAKKELFIATPLEMDDKLFSQNYFEDSQDLLEFSKLDGYRSITETRMTKTGKQAISRKTAKTTTTTTIIPWRHTSKAECLGQKTNFPSLVTSVCATQLATKHMQRNVKYKHVKSKIRLYFDSGKKQDSQIDLSPSGSDYSLDPDHEVELSSDKLETKEDDFTLSDFTQTNTSLNETFNLPHEPPDEYEQSGTVTINITPELGTNQISSYTFRTTPNPTQELEYLRLKREITQECVKYNIFTPAGVNKMCQKVTRNRSHLDTDRVSNLIGQILRELSD